MVDAQHAHFSAEPEDYDAEEENADRTADKGDPGQKHILALDHIADAGEDAADAREEAHHRGKGGDPVVGIAD